MTAVRHINKHVNKLCDEVYNNFNYDKYQLSLTNPRDTLHHGKHAANKDGRSM